MVLHKSSTLTTKGANVKSGNENSGENTIFLPILRSWMLDARFTAEDAESSEIPDFNLASMLFVVGILRRVSGILYRAASFGIFLKEGPEKGKNERVFDKLFNPWSLLNDIREICAV